MNKPMLRVTASALWQAFSSVEGLQTPPSAGPQVSRWGGGWRPAVGRVTRSGDLVTTWAAKGGRRE